MKTMTYKEKLSALAEILPAEFIELVKGHFNTILFQYQTNEAYNKAYPQFAKANQHHEFFKNDKIAQCLTAVEDHLWKRADKVFHDWLYDSFEETEEVQKYIVEENFD